MEYLRGWRAIKSDPEGFRKVGMGALMVLCGMFIPVAGPLLLQMVLLGWASLMLRRAVSGQDAPLPRLEFDIDYLKLLIEDGFKAFLVRLIWSLPMTAIIMASMCCMYAAMFGMMATAGVGAQAGGEVGAGIGGLAGMCMMLGFWFALVVLLQVVQMPLHMALIRVELTGDLNQGMRFKEVLDMTKMVFKELFFGQLVMGFIGFGCVLTGELMCFVGLFPAVIVMHVLMTFWHAEVYKVYLSKGGEPLPVGPLAVGTDVAQGPGAPAQAWDAPKQF